MQDIPYGYCHCGCGEKTEPCPYTARSIGWVRGEPKRYIHGHQSRKSGPKYRAEDRGYTTPCWIFTGHITKKGYGQMRLPGDSTRMYPAHRVFYMQHKGPIPDGKQLDHLCRVRECVNPDHLEPVTNLENSRRGAKAKLDRAAVLEIRNTPMRYGLNKALAAKFGVHPQVISDVRHGRRGWTSITE